MSERVSTYGKSGSAALVAAGVVWAIAVALGESGSAPDPLTQGLGLLGIALLAVGMIALVYMLIGFYTGEDA